MNPIARNMIEEAYEAVDAIEQHDAMHLREELGDVLLQVVLQSQIAADAGEFTVADVCRDVNAKMIRRHPHVFGEQAGGLCRRRAFHLGQREARRKERRRCPDRRARGVAGQRAR